MTEPGPTEALATYAAELRFADLPAEVVDHVKLCLLDTVGCGLYGATLPWTRILAEGIADVDAGGPATGWGTAHRFSAPHAALVNGAAVHGFELDDLHQRSIVHPGSVVLPAVLAVAEHQATQGRTVSGREFVTAVVAGYEVAARVGAALGVPHLLAGWHPTGTHGAIGAAAAAGATLGLAPDVMRHCLGTAGSQAGGLMAAQYGSMVKRFHAGRAAQSGVYSALLAARGYTGILDMLENDYGGYCTTFSPSHDAELLIAGLGTEWQTLSVGFKPYSTNGSCHPAIDALLELRFAEGIRPDQVSEVDINVSTATKLHVGWDYEPSSVTAAQMNLPYIASVVLADGDAFVDQFTAERIHDPALVAESRKVRVTADAGIDARGGAYRHATRLRVVLTDGRILSASRDHAHGSAHDPLTAKDVAAKFTKLATKVHSAAQAERLHDAVWTVDDLDDVTALGSLLADGADNGKDPVR
jgi:aconitate decarboxylase